MNRRQAAIKKICQEFGVGILYAFGSHAKDVRDWVLGAQEELPFWESDVDIGAQRTSGGIFSVTAKVQLAISLENFFQCPRVDLVLLHEADPFLAAEIIKGERIFAWDEDKADEYDLYILRRAGDFAFLEKERIALILGESA